MPRLRHMAMLCYAGCAQPGIINCDRCIEPEGAYELLVVVFPASGFAFAFAFASASALRAFSRSNTDDFFSSPSSPGIAP
mmetsp:Transcript_22274/g.41803  ORF Transcript_22274/g.41803 Transcript_22274/m.41803 type:complete len:80 (+) Transcript_22274:181-420(+)